MSKQQCKICEQGTLTEKTICNEVVHNGVAGHIQMCFSICDFCGTEQGDAAQTRANKQEMITFRKFIGNAK